MSADPTLREGYAACRRLVAARARSFRLAIRLLPRGLRDPMASLYAFCRLCDDAVDGEGTVAERRARLDALRRAAWRAIDDSADRADPVLAAFGETVRSRRVDRRDIEALLAAVGMDLDVDRYAGFEDLARYCDGVAGAVGRMCLDLFGARSPAAAAAATSLGHAMQVANILRDVAEDASRGRIYLPTADLARFGVSEREILGLDPGAGFPRLVALEAERSRALFAEAAPLAGLLPREVRFFPVALARVYGLVLDDLARGGFDPIRHRPAPSRLRMAKVALGAWAACRWGSGEARR